MFLLHSLKRAAQILLGDDGDLGAERSGVDASSRFAESEQRIGERGGIAGCGGDKKADRAVAQGFGEPADDGRVLGPDHDVAGMWLGMEEAVLKHHLRDHVQRVACDLLAKRRIYDRVDARPEEAYAPPNQTVICWQAGMQAQGIQNSAFCFRQAAASWEASRPGKTACPSP
jgi:hypothetical protein